MRSDKLYVATLEREKEVLWTLSKESTSVNCGLKLIGINISERKSGTQRSKKREKRELVFFHHQGAQMVL